MFKIFEPQTINRAIMPLIIANSIFGMGNFNYRENRTRCVISFIYSMCCLVSFCILTKVSTGYIDLFFVSKARELGNIMFKALFYGNVFLTISLMVAGWINIKGLERIITRVGMCDRTMEKMGMPKHYRKLVVNQFQSFASIGVLLVMFMVVNSYCLFLTTTPLDVRIMLTVTVHVPIVLVSISSASFVFWVRYTRLKFEQLNNLLRGMLTTTPDSPQHKRVLAMKYDIINKNFFSLRGDRVRWSNDNTDTMKAVKQIHLELVKSARNMNEMYGVQILLTLTASFVLITGLLYEAYTIVLLDLSASDIMEQIVPVAVWIFFYALKIFVVNHACAQTSAEAANTGDIICELYEPSTSREFRAEIRDFTLQLIQNPLIFTACGFFDLDHTFIQGVIGSITTYLVILIQVGEIPKPEDSNNTTNIPNDTEMSTITVKLN